MKIYSVSELTTEIRQILEERFPEVWIEGEISNFRPASSGHFYLSLKDANAQIRVVMFRGANLQLRFRPENGLSVLCYGRVSVYEPRGEYQIIVEHMEPKGIGAMQLAFEQLKKKLEGEGLFDPSRKRKIPFLPQRIGIVTSPTGSVIRDMIDVLTRRFSNIRILLRPVAVQGEGAAADIVEAIADLNSLTDIDLLIVGRGGGSVEDLWTFNEEVVARAIAGSRIPVISAVGHETDFTVADFVADLRAPTPSAAAELAVPVKEDLLESIWEERHHLQQAMEGKLETIRLELRQWVGYFSDPGRRLTEPLLKVDHLRELLISLIGHQVEGTQEEFRRLATHLKSLNPVAVLERGYAIATRRGNPRPIRKAEEVSEGESIDVRLHSGSLVAGVHQVIRR